MFEIEDYIFFYGSIYSQWIDSPFKNEDGVRFTCAEQFMMFEKAKLFGDRDSMKKIMDTDLPYVQKSLGRGVKGFIGEEWDKVKYNIVLKGNRLKFYQNPEMLGTLMRTGTKEIVEASATDTVWGIGLGLENSIDVLTNKQNWRGENLLGKVIMEVRESIHKEIILYAQQN
jgi:hypothetical protein